MLDKKPAPATDKPIIIDIDLKKVEIAEKTNIPKKKKEEKKEEKKEAKKEEPKEEKKKEAEKKSVAAPLKNVEPVVDTNAVNENTISDVAEKPKEKEDEQKMPPKDFTPPKRPSSLVKNRKPPKEEKKKKEDDDPLKSLLASVEKMENEVKADKPKKETEEDKKEEESETDITASKITISEIDAIRTQIKQCWNIDPGARGIADMVVEITVSLSADGKVIETNIVDKARYNSDSFFRSLADSAERAIHICSPLRVPADKYETWKDMRLYFNPSNGGVL